FFVKKVKIIQIIENQSPYNKGGVRGGLKLAGLNVQEIPVLILNVNHSSVRRAAISQILLF
ncbi:MAG: hypothetical protein AAGJ18_27645, partial [Bacteroidota bacterium]